MGAVRYEAVAPGFRRIEYSIALARMGPEDCLNCPFSCALSIALLKLRHDKPGDGPGARISKCGEDGRYDDGERPIPGAAGELRIVKALYREMHDDEGGGKTEAVLDAHALHVSAACRSAVGRCG